MRLQSLATLVSERDDDNGTRIRFNQVAQKYSRYKNVVVDTADVAHVLEGGKGTGGYTKGTRVIVIEGDKTKVGTLVRPYGSMYEVSVGGVRRRYKRELVYLAHQWKIA